MSFFNVTRDFVRCGYEMIQFLHFGTDIPQKRVIDHMIKWQGCGIEEIFFAADVQRWSEISHMAPELCVIPLPLTLLPDECTTALFQRPSRHFGSTVGVEFNRAPLSVVERFFSNGCWTSFVLLAPSSFTARNPG